jgi:hypothetical protein
METTDHNTILRILECRAKQFHPEIRLVHDQEAMDSWIDETGTLESPMNAYGKEVAVRVVEQWELQNLNEEVLEIHGVQPGKKPDGVVRLVYKNANGIDRRFKNNRKVEKAKEIHDDLEVDIAAYNKHRLKMQHKLNKVGFNQLFWGGEAKV